MNDFTIIDLLRHGEPDGGQKFRGAVDDPLSPHGWEQMRSAVGDCRNMKDPRSGPIAIAVIVLLLLNKFAALQALSADAACAALLLVPALGRAVIVALLLTTPYVRPAGLGAPYAAYLPRQRCGLLLALIAAATVAVSGWAGTGVLVGLGIGVIGLRQALMQRLGGITGDTLGAACELTEMTALLVLALA